MNRIELDEIAPSMVDIEVHGTQWALVVHPSTGEEVRIPAEVLRALTEMSTALAPDECMAIAGPPDYAACDSWAEPGDPDRLCAVHRAAAGRGGR